MYLPKVLKLILALLLLGGLVNSWPPYLWIMGIAAIAILGYLSFIASRGKRKTDVILYVALIILLQPFYKVSFHQNFWDAIYLLVAIGLLLSIIFKKHRTPQKP